VSRARLAITLAYHGALVVPGRAGPVLFRGLDPLPAARGRPCRHLRSCRTTAFERRSSPTQLTDCAPRQALQHHPRCPEAS